jgi:hypothetical protein
MIQNQVLGKGKIYLRARNRNNLATFIGGLRYIGNTPEFNLALEASTLDHFDSDNGIRVKDKSVTLEVNTTGSYICDNIDADNLAIFFLGTSSTVTQTVATVTAEAHTVSPGYYYKLGESNNTAPVNISAVVVTGVGGTPTYVAGDDYNINLTNSLLEIVVGGAIAINTPIEVDYSVPAASLSRVESGQDDFVGELFFEATNPEGKLTNYTLPYVKISPNGDFALNSDTDWQQMSYNIEVLKLDSNTPSLIAQTVE